MRIKWSEGLVADQILSLSNQKCPSFMPTASQMREAGMSSLASIMRSYGPATFAGWGERLGLKPQSHDSAMGWGWESWFAEQARLRGLPVEVRSRVKAPFDLTVAGRPVDVKAANESVSAAGVQWTWRIAKTSHACEVYAFVAISKAPPMLFLVPAGEVPLTCTTHRRRYNLYRDGWDIFGKAA